MNAPQSHVKIRAGNPKRRQALTAAAGVFVLAGLAWGAYEWLVASHYESTDNAY
ncbi:MAG: EmrA/EmrK family multidrug efflux transporter periplasmic adaptor subunit, partial [Pseudomonadota bacterium]|nr:EmrA/EmrK family multidrug efflux transporter periplasmic adaptor subunit [Pseudomonadota bacterium]